MYKRIKMIPLSSSNTYVPRQYGEAFQSSLHQIYEYVYVCILIHVDKNVFIISNRTILHECIYVHTTPTWSSI